MERFKGCVKAVSEYADVWEGTVETMAERHWTWMEYEDGKFNSTTIAVFLQELASAVSLNVELVNAIDPYADIRPIVKLNINGVDYWTDMANYDMTGGEEFNLCSPTFFSWFTPMPEDTVGEDLGDIPYQDQYVSEHGDVFTCVN